MARFSPGPFRSSIHHPPHCMIACSSALILTSSGSSGRVRGGAEKHEIYAAAFGGHLFYDLFLQGQGGPWPPWPPLDPLLLTRSYLVYSSLLTALLINTSSSRKLEDSLAACSSFVHEFSLDSDATLRSTYHERELRTIEISSNTQIWQYLHFLYCSKFENKGDLVINHLNFNSKQILIFTKMDLAGNCFQYIPLAVDKNASVANLMHYWKTRFGLPC